MDEWVAAKPGPSPHTQILREKVKGRHNSYYAYPQAIGEVGLKADPIDEGMPELSIKVAANTPRGGEMFSEAMHFFGSRVEGVRGRWLGEAGVTIRINACDGDIRY
jgi:hypothetical protein